MHAQNIDVDFTIFLTDKRVQDQKHICLSPLTLGHIHKHYKFTRGGSVSSRWRSLNPVVAVRVPTRASRAHATFDPSFRVASWRYASVAVCLWLLDPSVLSSPADSGFTPPPLRWRSAWPSCTCGPPGAPSKSKVRLSPPLAPPHLPLPPSALTLFSHQYLPSCLVSQHQCSLFSSPSSFSCCLFVFVA